MPTLEAIVQELNGRVRDVMVENVTSVHPDTPIAEAAQLMAEQNLRRMVVVDYRDKVIGVVSQRDLLKPYLFADQADVPPPSAEVEHVLSGRNPVTVSPELLLVKAAIVLATNKIGCLPVVGHRQQLVGLLTTTDLLRYVTGQRRDSLESCFQFYTPSTDARSHIPAYIRRSSGDLVVPLKSIEHHEAVREMVALGYDSGGGRILIKFLPPGQPHEGAFKLRRDKESLVISASDFVARFELAGKSNAFDVACRDESRYLVLSPKQGN